MQHDYIQETKKKRVQNLYPPGNFCQRLYKIQIFTHIRRGGPGIQLPQSIIPLQTRPTSNRRVQELEKQPREAAIITPSKIPRQKYYKYSHAPHGNIPVSSEVDPTDSLIILPDAENQNPVPESPRPEPEKIMQLRIPLMTPSQTAPEPQQTHTESVEAPTKPVEIITEEVIQTPTESVEAPTEPVEIITEEVIQEVSDTLYPSLTDELAPEIVDNIIAELRGDPELKDIIVEMEQQLELEEVGLEIDIPDLPDPLEDELENLLW